MRLERSEQMDCFKRGGKNFFYLADTVWSAFTNADQKDWEDYLSFRKRQGFNALQMNVLPQWDRSKSGECAFPYAVDEDGKIDCTKRNDAYFQNAQKILEQAVEYGFLPVLVILWCDCVPGTWLSQKREGFRLPYEMIETHVNSVVEYFERFEPVYFIGGDTDFGEESSRYYRKALKAIRRKCPEALAAIHMASGIYEMPDDLLEEGIDFYAYQSGHRLEEQQNACLLAEKITARAPRCPVINAEPCYEGHGHGDRYGRFGAFDVRKAIWQSLLSGAAAGVAYGAHGIWSWHREGDVFEGESFAGQPFYWREALALPGASDAAFAKQIFEEHDLFGITPAQELLERCSPQIRCGRTKDGGTVVVYAPYAKEIKMNLDRGSGKALRIDLENRKTEPVEVRGEGGRIKIPMQSFNRDILLIIKSGGSN